MIPYQKETVIVAYNYSGVSRVTVENPIILLEVFLLSNLTASGPSKHACIEELKISLVFYQKVNKQ